MLDDCLADDTLLFWYTSRFMPRFPPIYASFMDLPVRVLVESVLMDRVFDKSAAGV